MDGKLMYADLEDETGKLSYILCSIFPSSEKSDDMVTLANRTKGVANLRGDIMLNKQKREKSWCSSSSSSSTSESPEG